jgi:hypothetical protein
MVQGPDVLTHSTVPDPEHSRPGLPPLGLRALRRKQPAPQPRAASPSSVVPTQQHCLLIPSLSRPRGYPDPFPKLMLSCLNLLSSHNNSSSCRFKTSRRAIPNQSQARPAIPIYLLCHLTNASASDRHCNRHKALTRRTLKRDRTERQHLCRQRAAVRRRR